MKLNKEIREYKTEEYMWVKPGEECWVELDVDTLPDRDGDVFIPAKIEDVDFDKKMTVIAYDSTDIDYATDVHITRIMKRDPNQYPDLADLVDLPVLNDAELHEKIRDRFKVLNIFTYIGPSLLIVNPFKYLPDQYKETLKKEFYDCIMNPGSSKVREKPPHVWAMAANCYLELYNNKLNQACCISGESGAGKTVNTKTCMSFLTGMNDIFGSGTTAPGEARIEDKILMCNPVLEALGNAKTVRNDNSSRFGKYVSLYMANKIVVGASVESYLLEAIRVTTPNKSERNYHIFYQYLKGASEDEIKMMKLSRDPNAYPFLEKSGCWEVATVDDLEEYKAHEDSMKTLNLQGDWREAYWRITAAVLHISKVKYDDSNYNGSNSCEIPTENVLSDLMDVIGVEKEKLHDALTCRTSIVMGKEIVIFLDKSGCVAQSEAFAKDIYSKMFSWVIKYLNLALLPEAEKKSGKDPAKVYQKIGLLDIFGFEIFEFNSIEQLCINFTNEKLHQLYVEYVFKLEVQTFVEEGLKQFLANLTFNDNQEVLDLLAHPETKKFSVFNLIDDQSATMSKDLNIIDQFNQLHSKNPKMAFSKTKRNMFFIVHTARAVGYTIDGFCEKNKDEVPRPIIKCVLSSKYQRIVDIYCQKVKDTDVPVDYLGEAVKKKESFIGYKFRQQMDALMNELRSCQCSFMRCIKPNEQKSATVWTSSLVVLQIRYLGLLDSIKIRKESYPFRFFFKPFVLKYLELEPTLANKLPSEVEAMNPDYKILSQNIIKNGIPEHTDKTQLIGKTRVFMKIEAFQHLELAYEKAVKVKKDAIKAIDATLTELVLKERIEAFVRRCNASVIVISQMIYGMKTKQQHKTFKTLRRAVLKIQANFRSRRALRQLRLRNNAASILQSAMLAAIAQKKAREKFSAAKIIGRYYRNYRLVSSLKFYIELLRLLKKIVFTSVDNSVNRGKIKSAITIQKRIRGILARKAAAEEVHKIKTAKELFKYDKAIKIMRKFIAGSVARKRLKRIIGSAAKIQAYFKMKWTEKAYVELRRKTIFIQRHTRAWLDKKFYADRQRTEFLKNHHIPFLKKALSDQSRLYKVNADSLKKELGKELPKDYEAPKIHKTFEQVPPVESGGLSHLKFFMEVIDLDYLKDVITQYQGGWAKGFVDSAKDARKVKTEARALEIGGRHSVLATLNGRCYCWGRNEYHQLGIPESEENMSVFRVLRGEERLRGLAVGDDHSLLLTRDRSVFVFGRNEHSQLGLNHKTTVHRVELNNQLSKCLLKSIHAKGRDSYAVTEQGEVLFWPVSPYESSIGILKFPPKEVIEAISLGRDFVMAVSNAGNLYSFGRENRQGQLGLGHTSPVLSPTLVSGGLKERIVGISCGKSHSLCLTRNGKLYSWGAGSQGQLGNGETSNLLLPSKVTLPSNFKLAQICASYSGSWVIGEDGSILFWGSSSKHRVVTQPTQLRSQASHGLFPVQIRSSWSDNLCVTSLQIADFRLLTDLTTYQQMQLGKLLTTKWAVLGSSQFELPPCPSYTNLLAAKNLEVGPQQDLKRAKPDPLSEIKTYDKIYMSKDDSRIYMSPRINKSRQAKVSTAKKNGVATPSVGSPKKTDHPKPSSNYMTPLRNNVVAKSDKKSTPTGLIDLRFGESNRREKQDSIKSPYVSSTRRNQEMSGSEKIDHMMKSGVKSPNQAVLSPSKEYTVEELKDIKFKIKKLLLKPRKNWTSKEEEYFVASSHPELKEKLKAVHI